MPQKDSTACIYTNILISILIIFDTFADPMKFCSKIWLDPKFVLSKNIFTFNFLSASCFRIQFRHPNFVGLKINVDPKRHPLFLEKKHIQATVKPQFILLIFKHT